MRGTTADGSSHSEAGGGFFSNANGGSVTFPNPGLAADQGSSLIYYFFLEQTSAQQQQQQQQQQQNEINTARRLLKIGFAPVDWLYSESLTKSTKSIKEANFA